MPSQNLLTDSEFDIIQKTNIDYFTKNTNYSKAREWICFYFLCNTKLNASNIVDLLVEDIKYSKELGLYFIEKDNESIWLTNSFKHPYSIYVERKRGQVLSSPYLISSRQDKKLTISEINRMIKNYFRRANIDKTQTVQSLKTGSGRYLYSHGMSINDLIETVGYSQKYWKQILSDTEILVNRINLMDVIDFINEAKRKNQKN